MSQMQFSINSKVLLKELELLEPLTSRKSALPDTTFVLLESTPDGLYISATDLESTLVTHCPFDSMLSTDGAVGLPAKKLRELARRFGNSSLNFFAQENHHVDISVKGKSEYTIPGKDPSKMNSARRFSSYVHSIPCGSMAGHIIRTKFGMPKDGNMPSLKSMIFLMEEDRITTVCLDGNRVPIITSKVPFPVEAPVNLLIPAQPMDDISRLCGTMGKDDPLWLAEEGNHLFFKAGNREYSATKISGIPTPWQGLLGKVQGHDKKICLQKTDFEERVSRVAVVAEEKGGGIKVTLSSGLLQIQAQSETNGKGKEMIAVDYEGPELIIGFNANYLGDFLSTCKSETVTLELKDPALPGVIRSVNEEGFESIYLCMPAVIMA